ncbi:WRKY domain-containing protein [Cephalotus follicularis]|uniref:WRKY domain-containing protein n=1 Tax=Cephalotus follicularis TaxID=3775 RepID=A0A1Q3AN04_CEPFO|nr:WRKY domain-containing protein [Cephalotus follicularis]
MEKAMDTERIPLINELNQGKELTEQLRKHLNSFSANETRQFLVEKILGSYEKALSLLNGSAFVVDHELKPTIISSLESPNSFADCSPRSEEDWVQESKDHNCHKEHYKKRKTMPRWTEQVRVCTGSGPEGPLNDGYCWRKYGQKDILGSKFPRGYYRCTHRHTQDCLATKQVQRSDEDPTIFEVTYRGRHTCIQAPNLSAVASMINVGSEENKDQHQQQQQCREETPEKTQDSIFNFGTDFTIKSEDLGTGDDIFPSFMFPSAPNESENAEESVMEKSFMGDFCPSFISPTISESNYFSVSPCHMNSFELGNNEHTLQSDHTQIISTSTSITSTPIGDFDFSLIKVDFETNFPFDVPKFFC